MKRFENGVSVGQKVVFVSKKQAYPLPEGRKTGSDIHLRRCYGL